MQREQVWPVLIATNWDDCLAHSNFWSHVCKAPPPHSNNILSLPSLPTATKVNT